MPGFGPPWQIALAVSQTNQPTACTQHSALPWTSVKVQHTASATARGRRESRSIKTCAIAGNLGGIAFPHAHLVIRVHRHRKPTGQPETRESVYAVSSLAAPHQTRPAVLASAIRGRFGIENVPHYIRDVTFAEDASTIHAPPHPAPWPPSATSPSAP
ncbi:hypothetical protein ACFY1U_22985 [Streptomyces sp. NPDC001351]|uniref:hypothetical protein n=1 Tax=Streptomyces sp. NPDC001351 TaxID=3364564 RepID=UPI0036A6BD34